MAGENVDLNIISGISTINKAELNSFQFNNMLNGYLESAFAQNPNQNIPLNNIGKR